MSTITRFTKEQLIARALENRRALECFPVQTVPQMDLELIKIALASLEDEPVAWTSKRSLDVRDKITAFTCKESAESYGNKSAWESVVPLYAAPPAPEQKKE